jgi:hypothetical protein
MTLTRRQFDVFLGAFGAAALFGCAGQLVDRRVGAPQNNSGTPGNDGGAQRDEGAAADNPDRVAGNPDQVNRNPVWKAVPTLQLVPGTTVSIAGYVSAPDRDALTVALHCGVLPPGVTFDPKTMSFVVAADAPTGSAMDLVLAADDGRA